MVRLATLRPDYTRGGFRALCLQCCTLVAVVLCVSVASAGMESVRVKRVFDGDTCLLEDGRRVRLAGIDAPETAHGRVPAQYYAGNATTRLVELTKGQLLQLAVAGDGSDRYGRIVGELRLPNGASLGEILVSEGAATYYWHSGLPGDLLERLLAAQHRAMETGRGVWPRILALPRPPAPYVGNAATRRFHSPDCPDARRISPKNKVYLANAGEAFKQGFSPARDCTPWPVDR